jgi:hypothetical protein
MATNGVRQYTICRTEVVINTKRNRISVERDISFSQNYYLKPNHVPLQFHDLISNQKAMVLFPSTQSQNNLEWIPFWRNRLPPSSEYLLKIQTVIYSETLLPRPHVILTYTTLCLFATVKNWSKKQSGWFMQEKLNYKYHIMFWTNTACCMLLHFAPILCYGLYCLSNGTTK